MEHAVGVAELGHSVFDVVRFERRQHRLTLLAYPQFFDEAFPELAASWLVDLQRRTFRMTRYDERVNAPILHRKETLLSPDHPRSAEFAALTQEAEQLGLFEEAHSIGTRAAWCGRLERLGLRTDGNRLVPDAQTGGVQGSESRRRAVDTDDVVVQRHRTALQRYALSTPMQALYRHGYLAGDCSVFDYGCGRGDDLRILRALGLTASGWDPYFAPKEECQPSDVVNIGFVINVIEDPREREQALLRAFALARRVLSISALIGGRTAYERNRLYADGVITSRNTFQKYFQQQELREYIQTVLDRDPVAIGPGLFFVFADDDEEQNFLAARQLRARCPSTLPPKHTGAKALRAVRTHPPARAPRVSKWEANQALLNDFWARCLELGRLPRPEEYSRLEELRRSVGAPKSVLSRLAKEHGADALTLARRDRMNDVLVYLALNALERRRSREKLAATLRPDIAAFWGSLSGAQDEGRRLLFSIADTAGVLSACREAASGGIGFLDGEHSLTLRPADVGNLPPLLRVYIQAGVLLFGDISEVDLIKVHTQSGKLTLFRYENFEACALPRLRERIKVNLRRQVIDFFDGPSADKQLCFPKSRYLSQSDSSREALLGIERKLLDLGLLEDEYGCLESALRVVLERQRVRIDEARLALVPVSPIDNREHGESQSA